MYPYEYLHKNSRFIFSLLSSQAYVSTEDISPPPAEDTTSNHEYVMIPDKETSTDPKFDLYEIVEKSSSL